VKKRERYKEKIVIVEQRTISESKLLGQKLKSTMTIIMSLTRFGFEVSFVSGAETNLS